MADRVEPTQRIQITRGLVFALAALIVVVHEVHELAHTTVGRLLCGGWGPRDFNSWSLPPGCTSALPTLAGPVFSFALMWLGAWLLGGTSRRPLALGLVIAANPFARLLTAGMGGGDEGVLVRHWTGLERGAMATTVSFAIVAILVALPLWRAWSSLAAPGRAFVMVALLFLPMLVTGVLLFLVGNRLLAAGVLSKPEIAGAPALVWLVTLASVALLFLLREHFETAPGGQALEKDSDVAA